MAPLRKVALPMLLLCGCLAAAQIPRTAVMVGPASLSTDTFGGVGGASGGGGGTRLLVDYPEPQRSAILDMLFKPMHGAALQHIKVEIGCDGDTTQGSEPTHARSSGDVDFDRGYEVWLMQEAVRRRPEIQLSGLEWGIPGWVEAAGGLWGATNVDYLTEWAAGLQRKGLNLTALAVGYNERSYDAGFIKAVRERLDSLGMAHVKTIAPDSWGHMWQIVSDMKNDSALADAIDVLGTHQECSGAPGQVPPPGTAELGKLLWSTEQHIGEFGSFAGCAPGTPSNDLPVWDYRAAVGLARALNQGYLLANMTSTLIWTPVYAWYEWLVYGGKGLIVANTPWSGWYAIPDAVWMVAHTTQFVQPGWRFADRSGSKLAADGQASVVSYISPDGREISIVIESAFSNTTNAIDIQLTGAFAALKSLNVWRSQQGSVFTQQPPLQLVQGACSVNVPPRAVLTLTSTTGQTKGGSASPIPARANFSLPWKDDFDRYQEDRTPRFTSDLHGVFTTAGLGAGKVLQQRTMLPPVSTAGAGEIYATALGDGSWVDYEVSIAARLISGSTNQAGSTPPFLFVGSHVGLFEEGSSCVLSGEPLPEICPDSGCCPVGKGGMYPGTIHNKLSPAGFVLKIYLDPNGQSNASWALQAGRHGPGDKCDSAGCPILTVGTGTIVWPMGEWRTVMLSAKRQAEGKTLVRWSVQPVGATGQVHTAQVDTVEEARAGIVLGNSMHTPLSQWDNLTVMAI